MNSQQMNHIRALSCRQQGQSMTSNSLLRFACVTIMYQWGAYACCLVYYTSGIP